MKTVRLTNNVVAEIIPDYALPVEKFYGQEFAALCVLAPDDVTYGWNYDRDTEMFFAPTADPQVSRPPTEAEQLRADVDYISALMGVEL